MIEKIDNSVSSLETWDIKKKLNEVIDEVNKLHEVTTELNNQDKKLISLLEEFKEWRKNEM